MDIDTSRYQRQMSLPEIGERGQKKLFLSSVLCIGAGGLGSPALLYLAAAGVGRIGIIDFDRVDESNLQRQVLFSTEDIGKQKAQSAAEKIKKLNPTIKVEYYDQELDIEKAKDLFPSYDVILDGTDNFETKFLINDAAVKFDKPWVYGAIQEFDGQVSVFNHKGGPCYRCLQNEKPKSRIKSCAENGVIGAVAGIIGVVQALQAIQIIIDYPEWELLAGKIWTLDTRTMQTRMLTLKKNLACQICSADKDSITLRYAHTACDTVVEVPVTTLTHRSNYTLIDVREEIEWQKGHIEGAILWPLSKLQAGDLPDIPKTRDIILLCQRGIRSKQAAHILKGHGLTNVFSLTGGYEAWENNQQNISGLRNE